MAQTLDVFWSVGGPCGALEVAAARRGRWFEPALVDALVCLKHDEAFWSDLASPDILALALAREPDSRASKIEDGGLDLVAEVFARVIDAKSPWTAGHSDGVADLAVRIGCRVGMSATEITDLQRAAWLHDVGKLGVSNAILDKPGPLSDAERDVVLRHPATTAALLAPVAGLGHLARVAAAHHERPDGRRYHQGLSGDALPLAARVLSCADIADALRTSRPYRPALPPERVLGVMAREVGQAIDRDCFDALSALMQNLKPVPATAPVVHVVPALLEDYTQAA